MGNGVEPQAKMLATTTRALLAAGIQRATKLARPTRHHNSSDELSALRSQDLLELGVVPEGLEVRVDVDPPKAAEAGGRLPVGSGGWRGPGLPAGRRYQRVRFPSIRENRTGHRLGRCLHRAPRASRPSPAPLRDRRGGRRTTPTCSLQSRISGSSARRFSKMLRASA